MAEVKKPRAQITISRIIDIESVTRYYKLQSASAAAPSKPTDGAAIPSGWTKTEPAYQNGATNRLYFVDQTIMTNGGIYYSQVSLSSSYEAAKEAWNKANNAQKTADGIANNIYIPGTVQINGGKIQAGSLDVSKILMGDPSNLSQLSEHTYKNLGWSSKSDEKEEYQVRFYQNLQSPIGDRPEYNLKVPVSYAYSGNPQGIKYLLTMDDYDIVGYTAATSKFESIKEKTYVSLSPKILYTAEATTQPFVAFEKITSNTWALSMPESMATVKDFRFYMCIAKANGVPSGLTYITLSISNLRITKITDGSSITGIIKSTNYVEDSNGDCISGMLTNYSSGEIRTPNGTWDANGIKTSELNAVGGKIGKWVIDLIGLSSSVSSVDNGVTTQKYLRLYPLEDENEDIIALGTSKHSDAGVMDTDIFLLKKNGDISTRGDYYHNGYKIGETIVGIKENVSIKQAAWVNTGASITLPPGTYMMVGTINFGSCKAGRLGARFATGGVSYGQMTNLIPGLSTNAAPTSVQVQWIMNVTDTTKYDLQAFQSSTAAVSCSSWIKAVRIA